MPEVRLQRDEVMVLLEELGNELADRGIREYAGMNMVLTFTDELHTIKNIYLGIAQGDDPRYAVGTFLNDFFDYHAEARQALITDPIVVEEHPQPEHWR